MSDYEIALIVARMDSVKDRREVLMARFFKRQVLADNMVARICHCPQNSLFPLDLTPSPDRPTLSSETHSFPQIALSLESGEGVSFREKSRSGGKSVFWGKE